MVLFKKGELKLLWPFYLDHLLSPMVYFMPVFYIIYFRNLGFSLFQISIFTMMWPLIGFLFEIPTGAIADIYGRKFSVLLGSIINGLATISIFFLDSYYALIFAFAIASLGNTFNSGAREAWITDLINKHKKGLLHDYFVKGHSLDSFGLVISGILGAFLVKRFGVPIIWIFAGISFAITIILLGFAKENFVKKSIKLSDSFRNLKKQSAVSVRYAKNHLVLFPFLIAMSFIIFAGLFNGALVMVPFLQNLGLPEYAFGYLWSAMGAVGIFAPFISLKFLKKSKERQFMLNVILLTILVLVLIIFVNSIAFAFFILLSQLFLSGMSRPVERLYFHKFIKSKLRATVGSVESMLMSIIGIIATPLAGLSVDYLGPRYTILISAFLMIPAAIIFFRIKEPENPKNLSHNGELP